MYSPREVGARLGPTPMSEWDLMARLVVALACGGAIGLERTYHGRAAGLRTYALVCFGSALLVAVVQYELRASVAAEISRVIQGIVTGIGFLGAGVIVKEGFSVRGLTTAASIWVASSIGVAIGLGSYGAGVAASAVTLIALALLRRLEDRLPTQTYAHFEVGFDRARVMDEERLRQLIRSHGFDVREIAYGLARDAHRVDYQAVIWSTSPDSVRTLEQALLALPEVVHLRISPSRD